VFYYFAPIPVHIEECMQLQMMLLFQFISSGHSLFILFNDMFCNVKYRICVQLVICFKIYFSFGVIALPLMPSSESLLLSRIGTLPVSRNVFHIASPNTIYGYILKSSTLSPKTWLITRNSSNHLFRTLSTCHVQT
jgi:hypothetical protein